MLNKTRKKSVPNYTFSVQRCQSGEFVPLTICSKDKRSEDHFRKVWHKMTQSVMGHYKSNGNDGAWPDWVNWKPHEWTTKNIEDREEYIAWDDDSLAGFLNIRIPFQSQNSNGSAVYIEHIATSPGNQLTPIWSNRLRYVGIALLAYSVKLSIDNGFGGVVALHSTNESGSWYDKLNEERGGTLFYEPISGVDGYYSGSRVQKYYEMIPEGAKELLDDYLNE